MYKDNSIIMNCIIECSYREIIDKLSILQIKLEKVKNYEKKSNIQKEFEILSKYKTLEVEKFYNELLNINKILWELEDNIRIKSNKKEFDSGYINISENIHITNDRRYEIKNKINYKFNSNIKEEKIYKIFKNKINIENNNPNNKKDYIKIINDYIGQKRNENINMIEIERKKFVINLSSEEKQQYKNCIKDIKNSKIQLENYSKKYPKWYLPFYNLAKLYVLNNDKINSYKYFKKSLELNKADITINIEYSNFLHKYDYDLIIKIKQFINCVFLDRKNSQLYINVVVLILYLRDTNQIIVSNINKFDNINYLIDVGLIYNKNNYLYIANIARIYELQNNYDNALKLNLQAIDIEPKNSQILYNTSLILINRKDTQKCEEYLLTAMKEDPELIYIHKLLIRYYVDRGLKLNKALVYCENAYDKFKTKQFLLKKADILLRLLRIDEAEKYFIEILKNEIIKCTNNEGKSDDNSIIGEIYYNFTILYRWKRDYKKCKEYYDIIIPNINKYFINKIKIKNVEFSYGQFLLYQKDYKKAYEYLDKSKIDTNLLQTKEYSSFLEENASGETLVIYNNGGLGDIIMYGRFLTKVCAIYYRNKIILLIDDKLEWMFKSIKFPNNMTIIPDRKVNIQKLLSFYHCDVFMLAYYLGYNYSDIYFEKYLNEVKGSDFYNILIAKYPCILSSNKKIAINWHGNRGNNMEEMQRGIELELLEPLFTIKNITWISIQKNINPKEKQFLKDNNVIDLSDEIDTGDDAFIDTVNIFHNVDLVISTDTSILHLSASLGIETWALITYTPEYRWGLDERTVWYPEMELFRQEKILDWSIPIKKIKSKIELI